MNVHRPEQMVLLLSDIQPGLRTATFNSDVCAERFNRLVETTIRLRSIHATDRKVDTLYVAAAGDFVEGEPYTARVNLAELDVDPIARRAQDIMDQKRLLQKLLYNGLVKLQEHFEFIHFIGVAGNHGAGRGKFASFRGNDDLDVYYNVADRLSGKGISFTIATDSFYQVFYAASHPFLLVHGDQIRMWSRTPLYGIINATTLWHQVLPEPFHAVLMGHFHSLNLIDAVGTPVYVNGCFSGDSQYGAARGLKATTAQWLLGVHEQYGITWERRIWLEERQ